jgi:hypothetical protein
MKKQVRAIAFSGIEKAIITVKGQNVIIDSDVARIYGVETKRVNEAIKENPDKFPTGYILKLTNEETYSLRSEKTTLEKLGRGQHSKYNPTAFTEKGLYMLATILKSPKATAATIAIIVHAQRQSLVTQCLALVSLFLKMRLRCMPNKCFQRQGKLRDVKTSSVGSLT